MLSKDARRDVAGTNGKKARPQHSVWGVATLERTQDRSKNSPVAFLSLKGEGGYFSAVAFRQVASRLLSVEAGQGLAVVYFGHLEPKVEADGKAKGSRLLISQAYPAKSSAQVTPPRSGASSPSSPLLRPSTQTLGTSCSGGFWVTGRGQFPSPFGEKKPTP